MLAADLTLAELERVLGKQPMSTLARIRQQLQKHRASVMRRSVVALQEEQASQYANAWEHGDGPTVGKIFGDSVVVDIVAAATAAATLATTAATAVIPKRRARFQSEHSDDVELTDDMYPEKRYWYASTVLHAHGNRTCLRPVAHASVVSTVDNPDLAYHTSWRY